MPRRSRKLSKTGIYHIMLRGNERKDIFHDEEDKERIIDTSLIKRKEGNFKLYAFCVMDNHLHMLINEGKDKAAQIIKGIATSYAYYYNKKHKRVGHVFQDRFKSEVIEDEGQLLEVLRYIHNNPVKANIAKKANEYIWSSYNFYIAKNNASKGSEGFLNDIEEMLNIFSIKKQNAVKLFMNFTKERTEEKFIDIDSPEDAENEDIKKQVEELLNSKDINIEDLKRNKELRDFILRELKFGLGIPGRQIARMLEVDRNIVQRITMVESTENRPL